MPISNSCPTIMLIQGKGTRKGAAIRKSFKLKRPNVVSILVAFGKSKGMSRVQERNCEEVIFALADACTYPLDTIKSLESPDTLQFITNLGPTFFPDQVEKTKNAVKEMERAIIEKNKWFQLSKEKDKKIEELTMEIRDMAKRST